MRLDVSGRRPWPGPTWDGYRIALEGAERPSFLGLRDGEAVSWSDAGRVVYLFGRPGRIFTPPGRRARREPTEMVIERIEVQRDGSPARLVADFKADRLYLEIGEERRKKQLESLLGALPLLQLPPGKGRKLGSRQREDVAELRRQIAEAVVRLRADGGRVSWNTVADSMGWEPSTLRRKAQSYGITHPSLLP